MRQNPDPDADADLILQGLERRNLIIRQYDDIPLADTEIVFPEKKIYIKPVTIIQLFITLIGGLVAAAVTVWNVRPDLRL